MKKLFLYVSILGCLLFSLVQCSTQKNKFVNRNFHAMGTYYNILYNGNLALKKGIDQENEKYQDYFHKILPIERMNLLDPKKRNDTVPVNASIGKAEEKAAKAIQKHSMFIAGQEYNYKIDEAFILLGKARYYDQRFVPAKSAFDYIINHYYESDQIIKAKVWKQKANLRMNYTDEALEKLLALQDEVNRDSPETASEVYATLAQAYLDKDELVPAKDALKMARNLTEDFEQKARYTYIRSQLFDRLNMRDSMVNSLQQVLDYKRRPPRKYFINAQIDLFVEIAEDSLTPMAIRERFTEFAENWENRNFRDVIYYRRARYEDENDSIANAITYYNESLKEQPKTDYLLSRDYLNLAQIYFDKNSYKTAGAYYDSTMTHLDKSTREYRRIKKKNENIDEVIKYEDIARKNDSILRLVDMKPDERMVYFEKVIDSIKEQEKKLFARSKQKEEESKFKQQRFQRPRSNAGNNRIRRAGGSNGNRLGGRGNNPQDRNNQGSFYFYEPNQVNTGKLAFEDKWGKIELKDNWRTDGNESSGKDSPDEEKEEEEGIVFEGPKYQTSTYIDKIPEDQKVIDSLQDERNYAYFQLGVIYKEKFREYALAIHRFSDLLDDDPQEELVLPSMYNLYLANEKIDKPERAKYWKNRIIKEHPDSQYAEILLNPEKFKNSDENPMNIYTRLYRRYEEFKLNGLLDEVESYAKAYEGMPVAPKFSLLKALVTARTKGLKEYKEELKATAFRYPQSNAGKKAQAILDKINRKMAPANFKNISEGNKFKLVFYPKTKNADPDALVQRINEVLQKIDFQTDVLIDKYLPDERFVVIKGLISKKGAEGLAKKLTENDLQFDNYDYFSISQHNYNIIQIHKNLKKYLNNA